MRILHTSDWHLGQSFYGKSRAAEHQAFLNWLLDTVEHHQVDALIVAGDIFDTSAPPSYARAMYNQFVVDMQARACQLIMVAGNHDSVAMLSESQALFACLGTHVVPSVQSPLDGQILPIHDSKGQLFGVVGAVPFLRPRDLVQSQAGEDGAHKQHKLGEAIGQHYDAVYQQAYQLAQTQQPPVPIIVTGHLTTVGASSSESVRDIYIGTLDAFNAHHFPPADYIALGHIHRGQKVAKTEHIRYCGSPLYLSFDELTSQKQVLLAKFSSHGVAPEIQSISVPSWQPMAVIKGELSSLADKIDALELPSQGNLWLSVELTNQGYVTDLQARIEQMIGQRPIEVLQLKRIREHNQILHDDQQTLSELSLDEVFARRLAQANLADEQEALRLTQLYQQVAANVLEQSQTEGFEHEQESGL